MVTNTGCIYSLICSKFSPWPNVQSAKYRLFPAAVKGTQNLPDST